MLGFPASTEFGKRIPKQKFYENLDVSPALRRVFVDQIRIVYWRNKLASLDSPHGKLWGKKKRKLRSWK